MIDAFEEFLNMLPSRFVFWICPNKCNGRVEWNKECTEAKCLECGCTSNKEATGCSLCSGIEEDGVCQSCGRTLNGPPIGG